MQLYLNIQLSIIVNTEYLKGKQYILSMDNLNVHK